MKKIQVRVYAKFELFKVRVSRRQLFFLFNIPLDWPTKKNCDPGPVSYAEKDTETKTCFGLVLYLRQCVSREPRNFSSRFRVL